MALISKSRRFFHTQLLENLITKSNDGTLSIADSSSSSSKAIASSAVAQLGDIKIQKKLPGQQAGSLFEDLCRGFLEQTFLEMNHLRPGNFIVAKGGNISNYKQYQHLHDLSAISEKNPEIATAIGQDYLIKPDIIVSRKPETDQSINRPFQVILPTEESWTPLRIANNQREILHATISCKYTIRSDRAQNARSEALNVIRNRKGHSPHIVVITAEPMPSRIASLALGTGDIDCVYHAFLPELMSAVKNIGSEDAYDLLSIMTNGDRLRDIADLPLDLAI